MSVICLLRFVKRNLGKVKLSELARSIHVKTFFKENQQMKKRNILILLIVFLTSCVTAKTSEDIKNAGAHYQLGLSYYNEDKIQPAYIEFQKALELNPKDKDVLNAIGIIYLLKFEDPPKAVEYFKKAIEVDPNFSEVYNNLGFAYEKAGRFNDAIDSYKKAISNPMYQNSQKAYNSLGRVYYRLGRYDEAIEAYKEALRRVNDFYPSYYGLALCYNAKGRYGDASTAITRAIELDPTYKGDKDKAREDFENRKLIAKGEEEKNFADYLEILRY
jgi:type IV pilus assembly protein PilF